jgi:hypothetical protein
METGRMEVGHVSCWQLTQGWPSSNTWTLSQLCHLWNLSHTGWGLCSDLTSVFVLCITWDTVSLCSSYCHGPSEIPLSQHCPRLKESCSLLIRNYCLQIEAVRSGSAAMAIWKEQRAGVFKVRLPGDNKVLTRYGIFKFYLFILNMVNLGCTWIFNCAHTYLIFYS